MWALFQVFQFVLDYSNRYGVNYDLGGSLQNEGGACWHGGIAGRLQVPFVKTGIPSVITDLYMVSAPPISFIVENLVLRIMQLSKKAFVLMPFNSQMDSYYSEIYQPALEAAGYAVAKADDIFAPRPIMTDIQDGIVSADVILCEMTGQNPNVFYELGLSHAIGKPAILVSNRQDDIPFDLRYIRVILYDQAEVGWDGKLREQVAAAARSVNQDVEVWPPPLIRDHVANKFRTNLFVRVGGQDASKRPVVSFTDIFFIEIFASSTVFVREVALDGVILTDLVTTSDYRSFFLAIENIAIGDHEGRIEIIDMEGNVPEIDLIYLFVVQH